LSPISSLATRFSSQLERVDSSVKARGRRRLMTSGYLVAEAIVFVFERRMPRIS